MRIRHRLVAALLVLTLGAGLSGCATNPVTGQQDFVLLSEDQEIALGRQEHPKILKQFGRYPDEKLQAYVQKVGERLAAKSHRPNLIFRFTVLDSPDVNAFALPGGYVYITRGLMAYLESEAELAAVLGHEIGHVTARHSVRQISAAQAAGLGLNIGAALVPELRNKAAQDLMNVLSTAMLRGYGREHELQADHLGAEYLARVGYDPHAMIEVIGVLKDQEEFEVQRAKEEHREPHIYHGVFATHPDNDTRLKDVVAAADKLKNKAVTRPPHHTEYLEALRGVTFGPSAREGVVRGNRFFHRDLDLAVSFPKGWTVENQPDRLIALAPKREAMLQLTLEERNRRIGPAAFITKRFGKSPEKGESLTVHGQEGYTGLLKLNTPFGRRQSRVTVLFRDKQAFVLAGAAKDSKQRARFDKAFLAAARSVHRLSDKEKALAKPLALELVTAGPKTTYETLAKESRLPDHAEARLRLLNHDYPKGEPKPGELLKIVQ
jgi:predicted Zn-dependent protease